MPDALFDTTCGQRQHLHVGQHIKSPGRTDVAPGYLPLPDMSAGTNEIFPREENIDLKKPPVTLVTLTQHCRRIPNGIHVIYIFIHFR